MSESQTLPASVHYQWIYSGYWGCTNHGWAQNAELELQAEAELRWKLSWAAVKDLRLLAERKLKPLLIVFKRFDFRSAPRWRSERWKAKT